MSISVWSIRNWIWRIWKLRDITIYNNNKSIFFLKGFPSQRECNWVLHIFGYIFTLFMLTSFRILLVLCGLGKKKKKPANINPPPIKQGQYISSLHWISVLLACLLERYHHSKIVHKSVQLGAGSENLQPFYILQIHL